MMAKREIKFFLSHRGAFDFSLVLRERFQNARENADKRELSWFEFLLMRVCVCARTTKQFTYARWWYWYVKKQQHASPLSSLYSFLHKGKEIMYWFYPHQYSGVELPRCVFVRLLPASPRWKFIMRLFSKREFRPFNSPSRTMGRLCATQTKKKLMPPINPSDHLLSGAHPALKQFSQARDWFWFKIINGLGIPQTNGKLSFWARWSREEIFPADVSNTINAQSAKLKEMRGETFK